MLTCLALSLLLEQKHCNSDFLPGTALLIDLFSKQKTFPHPSLLPNFHRPSPHCLLQQERLAAVMAAMAAME
jgi:hypothetical protein